MRWALSLLFASVSGAAFAQGPGEESFKGQPVEITASGGTNYNGGIATAHDNVAIHIGDTDIYGDSAEYDSRTHDVRINGHVRIYRAGTLYVGDRGTYNTETKAVSADDLRTHDYPFFLGGESVTTIADEGKLVQNGSFTTHDSANPDFRMRARTVRVYEGDRIIMRDVMFYVGKVPIFYWPYVYQSLDDAFSFTIAPVYLSSWGPSLLGRVTFPITDNLKGAVRLDYRGRRGVAIGFDADLKYGKANSSWAKLRTYLIRDQNPTINRTSIPRGEIPSQRFRLSLQDRTEFTPSLTGTVDLTKLSDAYLMEDFYQSEFRVNPQPDNIVGLAQRTPRYTLTAFTRFQPNTFFEVTERLPEIALDVTRQPIFNSPIFYEGETSYANLQRSFPKGSPFRDYSTNRIDSFHQFLYPNTYFGWLSIVPRVGLRGTYYSETRPLDTIVFRTEPEPLIPDFLVDPPRKDAPFRPGGDRFRTVLNAGVEASFKVSRTWEAAQSRALGLDGLRHVFQPFANLSYVTGDKLDPTTVLQFDRYQPSTQLRPIDFPQFTSIDSIDNWTIARLGMRNRLQTRRDDSTINWLELETYFDVNFDNPYDQNSFSNVYNRLRFSPLPWASLSVYAQLPLLSHGFTEVNTDLRFQPTASFQVNLGHRFLNENPFFPRSSLYTISAYYRLNDNWGLGAYNRFEQTTGNWEEQRYSVYRDLTSWVASLGTVIRNNGSVKEYGVLLTFTLKALPKFSFDLNFDPGSQGGTANGVVP